MERRVRLLHQWGSYEAGSVVALPKGRAMVLVASGLASYEPDAPVAPAEPVAEATPVEREEGE